MMLNVKKLNENNRNKRQILIFLNLLSIMNKRIIKVKIDKHNDDRLMKTVFVPKGCNKYNDDEKIINNFFLSLILMYLYDKYDKIII